MEKYWALLSILMFSLSVFSQQDTLKLKTGEVLAGQILDNDNGVVIFRSNGKTKNYYTADIQSIIPIKKEVKVTQEVKPLSFDTVIVVNETDPDVIYSKVRIWVADNFKSAKEVIQLEDKKTHVIVGNGTIRYDGLGFGYQCFEGWISFSFKVQVKEGRFKFEMTDFVHDNSAGKSEDCELGKITTADGYSNWGLNKPFQNKTWDDVKLKSKVLFLQCSSELYKAISNESDNW
jgi:hypothetical protein